MLCIVDSHAWIEYFLGSKKGTVLKELFSREGISFLTVECCLAEIRGWALRNSINFDDQLRIIRANSDIIRVTEQDWIAAAEVRYEQRKSQADFGLIDAVVLVKQKEHKAKIISGDKHFQGMRNVLFLR